MDWQLIAILGLLVGLGLLAVLLLISGRTRTHDAPDRADPMFWSGLAFVGAGTALIATAGGPAVALMAIGGAMMFTGAFRSRRVGKR